ncbi:hypothetical protein [Chryseobacterium pennipullorum]|uniref:Uncharacterized protein n=1 Tax=Chryseobacterium pennipullorum TaxID=2258963 RepID=A0A3D9B9I5_9FLAO|nr:hypothetical protein [Chryseobacterium pennipullorum]REC50401.1 hypothetical protein DRF67_02410 [Chryseobacterium pennipullorum]
MKDLIYNKIYEYDPKLLACEVSYSNRPIEVSDLIMSYKARNKMAKEKSIEELTLKVLNNLSKIKNRTIEYVKFVVVRKDNISRLFFFNEDYSEIFFDFILPTNKSFI